MGVTKFKHEFDFSCSAPEFLPKLDERGEVEAGHKKPVYDI